MTAAGYYDSREIPGFIFYGVVCMGRVSIFLDFWNFTLNLRDFDSFFRPDWYKIAEVFLEEAQVVVGNSDTLVLQDFNIFGSYSRNSNDAKLHNWATTFLPKVKGAKVYFYERKVKKRGPRCPVCHEYIDVCPKCNGSMIGTEEKGIDTLMATTMLQDAWLKKFDVAIIVSADRDFIPVVEILRDNGLKTIHAQFGANGAELTKSCWGRFNILNILDKIKKF